MTTSEQLIAALAQDHKNHDLYLIVADCLEEEGQNDLACVYRWCGMTHRYPNSPDDGLFQKHFWSWYWISGEMCNRLPASWWSYADRNYEIDFHRKTFAEVMHSLLQMIQFIKQDLFASVS